MMIEHFLELLLSVIDYTYFLYFFLYIIDEKWKWKRVIPVILCGSLIQFIKDYYLPFSELSLMIDGCIVVLTLTSYVKRVSINDFIHSLFVYGLFDVTTTFFVSCAIEFHVDISLTMAFGLERYVFSLLLKCFTIAVFYFLANAFRDIHRNMSEKADRIIVILMLFAFVMFDNIYSLVVENHSIIIYTIPLTMIMFGIFYLTYRYTRVLKEKEENHVIQKTMKITNDYVESLEKEHEEIRTIRHDIQNQLGILDILLSDHNYKEAMELLNEIKDLMNQAKVSISGNIYIDAVLRQKMNEYSDITFDLDLVISKDFDMKGADIISLLSNIIDNACEELHRIGYHSFHLQIHADREQLKLVEMNRCRADITFKTDKNQKQHGYGTRIIQKIVNKYHGVISYNSKDEILRLTITLFFN